jgi:hypothetical protein
MIVVLITIFTSGLSASDAAWETIDTGLELGNFKVKSETPVGDSTIVILRIDPAQWELRFLCSSENKDTSNYTAKKWCQKFGLVAATNAGMFATDYKTHVGYLKNETHLNNARWNKYQSAAAFKPLKEGLPPFRIFDLDVEEESGISEKYDRIVQNLRLIKRPHENRWSKQDKMWSEAALGEDSKGRILFIFCRSPYSMYNLNKILLSLQIDLVCAQHLEGGPEAQLYIKSDDKEYEFVGSYETSFNVNDYNKRAWPIPNVLGIVKKAVEKE